MIRSILVFGVVFGFALAAEGMFMWRPENVPVERLIANVNATLKKSPKDPQGYYVLGRIHSMAYAFGEKIQVGKPFGNKKPKYPGFAPYQSVRVRTRGKMKLTAERFNHLVAAIENYRKSVDLAKKAAKPKPKNGKPNPFGTQAQRQNARAALGLAWMYEQAATLEADARKLDWSKLPKDRQKAVAAFLKEDKFLDKAVGGYFEVMALISDVERKRKFGGPGADSLMSVDAARAILAIFKNKKKLSDKETADKKKLVSYLDEFKQVGRVVTPIIFSMKKSAPLSDLLAKGKTARFDLDGDGNKSRWPWVKGDTCFLVWDPAKTGKITSGRQLFGSVTWWIFWDDGFQAMASLDNNRDGKLAGKELNGLAVWRDKNGNGLSEKGEVVPVSQTPIKSLAVRFSRREGKTPVAPRGLELSNGQKLPIYDWMPKSVR